MSRKRGMFADSNQDPSVKALQMSCSEYFAAFHACDPHRTGFIDLQHLSDALQAVLSAAEVRAVSRDVSMRPFHSTTCCLLCTRFGDGAKLSPVQFCELLYYVHNLRVIFAQLDTDCSGGIDCAKLMTAFQHSGANMDASVVAQIVASYDADHSMALEFDEFVQMRLEWDHYISAWDLCTRGSPTIPPPQLLSVLEEVKRTTEPIITALGALGLSLRYIFHEHRPFQVQTCECLIFRFGRGSACLSFEQFCNMMVSLKEMKEAFCSADLGRTGSLNSAWLTKAMSRLGMDLPEQLVEDIGRQFYAHSAEGVEFDEFVQIIVEWNEVWRERHRFGKDATGRIGSVHLREILGSVRVIYRFVNSMVQAARPFNLSTCRWLIATFGTCQAGEAFAQGVTWAEFLNLVWFLKNTHRKFHEFTLTHSGALSADELGSAMATHGIHLSSEAIDNIRRSYDVDGSGTFEFDEFLQINLECQMYDQRFEMRVAYPTLLTATSMCPTENYVGGSSHGCRAGGSGGGVVALDKSAFFSLVFSVPRHVGRERHVAS